MFHKTSLKLTALYLSIIMVISFFFSVSLYNVSVREIERGFIRQTELLRPRAGPKKPVRVRDLGSDAQGILEEARSRVLMQILFINLLIFAGAGALSYYLARRTLQPIEEAHEALERFTADASHELRTPITAMKTEIETLLSEPKLTVKDARQQFASNLEELDRLARLSDGLLSLARMNDANIQKRKLRLRLVVQEAIDRVLSSAEKKHILIANETDDEALLFAEQTTLVEALVTILDNALKYSPDKSKVFVRGQSKRTHDEIVIVDQGLGIKATELPHIFDRFYRADSSRSRSSAGGYGLGLSIAKNIVDRHNGRITVNSTPAKGTVFTIRLPKV